MDPDPDPDLGGPKTCGSGGSGFGSVSATLVGGVSHDSFTHHSKMVHARNKFHGSGSTDLYLRIRIQE
jgi:hypothetical protein